MIKHFKSLFIFLLFLSACSESGNNESNFKVALLSPGPVSDAGWNASAYEGLLRIKNELGAQISQIETKTPSEFEEAFRDYGKRGYRLVFGHGFEFQDAAAAVAPDFPNTVYMITAGNTVRDNVGGMLFQLEQATYLAGVLAAQMSKTGKIGAVGGMQIPPVERTFNAFKNGAGSVDPDIEFGTSYIGNWEDAGAAKQATLALIEQDCDFIFHNADAAAAGVFQAAKERNVFAFGANKNQNEVEPQHIIASCVSDIPQAFVEIARLVQQNKFEARVYQMGMKENVVSFIINPALEKNIPPELKQKLSETQKKILSGSIQVLSGS